MTSIVKRFPTFIIDLLTEDAKYKLSYDTSKYDFETHDLEETIISFSTQNSMQDDSPVFSLVLLAKEKWDMKIGSNDLIRIRVLPNRNGNDPANPYVMVGLISDIHKEGEYAEGSLLYRITGRAMTKALMDFHVGTIREVAVPQMGLGWLHDGGENGLNFTQNTAAQIGDQLMDRFVYQYMNYSFHNGQYDIQDFLEHEFNSWPDEALADATPFVSYEGSMRQFLEDVTSRPFNELFFDFTPDGKCRAIMRPTPFDKEQWDNVHRERFTSDIVVEESFGKSDAEMASVFLVQPAHIFDFTSTEMGVYPKYHPELLNKYGYKKMEVENKYLMAVHLGEDDVEVDEETGIEMTPPSYDDLYNFLDEAGYLDPEVIRTDRSLIQSDMVENFPTMSDTVIEATLDALRDDDFTRDTYSTISLSNGDSEAAREINEEKEQASEKIEVYSQRLFNWFSENANFYSGDIRVIGDPRFRLGIVIEYKDLEQQTTWEAYVESVQHEFSFTNGYTTVLGITRGLPRNGSRRFNNLWGRSEEFKGGYLGEPTLEEQRAQSEQATNEFWSNIIGGIGGLIGGVIGGGGSGGPTAMAALQTAQRVAGMRSRYDWGGGRGHNSPFNSSPVLVDCSSFVWWCYYEHGVSLKGGKTGMTTDTIKNDPQLHTVSSKGTNKDSALSAAQAGDIVYFDTYKGDGHVGIYSGNGKFIGAQSSTGVAEATMDSGYWKSVFNGRVLRYKN